MGQQELRRTGPAASLPQPAMTRSWWLADNVSERAPNILHTDVKIEEL